VATSRTLLGPVLVWNQQKVSKIGVDREALLVLLQLPPPDAPRGKAGMKMIEWKKEWGLVINESFVRFSKWVQSP